MKKMALIAALMFGTAAVAQTTSGTMTDQTTTTTSTTMPTTTTDQTTPPDSSTTTTSTMSAPTTDSTMAAPTTAAPMTAPADSGMAAPAATGDYPRCTRTVTDHCKQSSARESDTKGGPAKHRRR
ncbi:hypothetical protein SPAN111604_01275 [Sphingomonas antarctica]|uniref:hypothetical protein n=1 Tax=Sphingomonas antarctica TaxID=2040274 RepID=UPI0039E72FD2